MQYVDRNLVPPPSSFRSEMAKADRFEVLRTLSFSSERLSQTTPSPRRDFKLASDDTLAALEQLFRGKCAFCESRRPINARLFRPAEEAEPLARSEFAHLYYSWLRTDWGNAYAVCTECAMAAGKQFPTRRADRGPLPATEHLDAFANENFGLWRFGHHDQRLLLDPCEDRRFGLHLSFSLDGVVQPLSSKGEHTIGVFRLNREDLVMARCATFESYLRLMERDVERQAPPSVFDFRSLEHGGSWLLLLGRIATEIQNRIGRKLSFTAERAEAIFADVLATPLGKEAFWRALDDVRHSVQQISVKPVIPGGKTQRLVGVEVENFKALQRLELFLPDPIPADWEAERPPEASSMLVLGENAAGKSSILEAVALALMDEGVRSKTAKPARKFVLDPALMGSDVTGAPPSAKVTLRFNAGANTTLTIADGFSAVGDELNLPPVFAYGAFRQYADSSPKRPPKGHVATLFKSDALLANPEKWLLALPAEEFAMVARALKSILVVEGEYDIIERDVANDRCLIVTSIGEGADTRSVKTPLRVVSSGFRSVLAMICDILAGLMALQPKSGRRGFAELEAVVLIDEVEAHLHPRWKMRIMTALRQVLPRAVIIATTHDPLCLRGMHDREVVVFNRTLKTDELESSALPVVVESITALPNVEDLTVEQLLTSDFFSMFSTDSRSTEINLAEIGRLLAKQEGPETLTPAEAATLEAFRGHVSESLPLGSSEVQRLVEEAMSEYVKKRRITNQAQMERLKTETRERILRALEAY